MNIKENFDNYDKLDKNQKQNVQMYLTARQFKNAILDDETVIIPSQNGKEYKIKYENFVSYTARGSKYIVRIIPYLANLAFSCELYLKLILEFLNISYDDLIKNKKGHNLYELYNKLPCNNKKDFFNKYNTCSNTCIDINTFEDQIKNVSEVFKDIRYVHEKIYNGLTINQGFLQWFSNKLDNCSAELIKLNYNYDVTYDMRWYI